MGIIVVIIVVIIIIALIAISCSNNSNTPEYRGADGESRVSNILRRLPEDYYTINNVIIPTRKSTSQIDHVVVSRYGVFVIETKNYSGWIFGANNSKKWKETFKSQSHYFYNPIKQNWGHIYALSEFLNLDIRVFKPVIAFSDEASLDVESTTPVIYMSELEKHILNYTQVIISDHEVKKIYDRISKVNLAGTDTGNNHTQNVRSSLSKQQDDINKGICPRCGGKLVLRNGRYGRFFGCSNYPKCRFTNDV